MRLILRWFSRNTYLMCWKHPPGHIEKETFLSWEIGEKERPKLPPVQVDPQTQALKSKWTLTHSNLHLFLPHVEIRKLWSYASTVFQEVLWSVKKWNAMLGLSVTKFHTWERVSSVREEVYRYAWSSKRHNVHKVNETHKWAEILCWRWLSTT